MINSFAIPLFYLNLTSFINLLTTVSIGTVILLTAFFVLVFFTALYFFLRNRKRLTITFKKMLYDDELTEIKNLTYLRENFNDILITFDQDVTMYYLNIDNFKNYNDLLGHKLANRILYEFANRLKTLITPFHTVYRVHSDHFIVLYPSSADEQDIFSKKLMRVLKEPYTASVHTIKITMSVGKYHINEKNPRFQDCLLKSELALQEAKSFGKDQIMGYSRIIKRKNNEAFSTFRLIKDALKERGFYLEYQPIINGDTLKVIGLESLIRVNHKNKIYYPQDIINYAEKYHLIEEIDRFVIQESFEAFKRLEKLNFNIEFMSINISTKEIKNLEFVDFIVEQAQLLDVNPARITIEFTETYSPEDFILESSFITRLQSFGFKVAVDDFGSGYSSMIRLSQNQLDKIKIDREFIMGISTNPRYQKIVEAMVGLSKTFDLDVIVEGVENKEDFDFVRKLNIKYIQGYYFYRALSEQSVINLLQKQN
ncbi:EAL domain-containing protein [Liberiplasma polymorphum]|uniref:EAL domain-containing protein n=1 Tax=Liberiplasma polymorphum TaxID=3374570 RepID=UPI003775C76F